MGFRADFSATYQSIGLDGLIVNGFGSAVADETFDFVNGAGNGTVGSVSFQTTLPEPSSIVTMALGLVAILTLVWMQGPALSIAAK